MPEAPQVRPAWIPVMCVAALVAAFVVDLLTPQLFITAILLDVPIVLSTIGGSRHFTRGLVAAALIANAVAGYENGVTDHYWSTVGLADRALAALSIVLVGYLSMAAQENAHRTERLRVQRTRAEREARLAAAIDRVRTSLSLDLVLRAIAREAIDLLGAAGTRFVVMDEGQVTTLVARAGTSEVVLDETRLSPELASLVQRTLDEGDVVAVRASDALGRLVLDTLGSGAVLALPIADRYRRVGVVLALAAGTPAGFDDVHNLARAYADQATSALTQARLFSQLAKRNEELEERGGVIRDLVYALSHDLRTPLAALGMTLRQAESGTYGELPPRYREILERSIAAIDDVARLAETLLLVARIESGDRRPERDLVELGPMVRQIAGELEALAAGRRVSLAVDDTSAAATVGDRSDLRRAVTNLVANALDHTPEGGRVEIEATRAERSAVLRVIDDGQGVTDVARRHLFTRFARTDARHGGGSGLGLYIVRRVAEESHGTVTYEPRQPHGSIFTLRLPLAEPPAAPGAP